ncbi:hypothetical protein Micbo1qcDRAFT_60842 [Microdochium bolleyi]|uniref:Zn(2)-C6 fungal-type domain-containing protein n=1 Tax=Microdochium bolleyi TaxID=196109 RepID=A0A136J501_9PEZI|nr:hypothetical protein Micbo1qcDRAFT_60842 [Microdochium bolleyi]
MGLPPSSFGQNQDEPGISSLPQIVTGGDGYRYFGLADFSKTTDVPAYDLDSRRSPHLIHLLGSEYPSTSLSRHKMFLTTNRKDGNNRKKKSTNAGEQVKHRRTRSGCLTCRGRRVKCDESHPVCQRCRKGNRECVYPESAATEDTESGAAKKNGQAAGRKRTAQATLAGLDEEPETDRLSTEPEDDICDDHPQINQSMTKRRHKTPRSLQERDRTRSRADSETPSCNSSKSWSASDSSTRGAKLTYVAHHPPRAGKAWDWAHLDKKIRFYLDYYTQHITYMDYGLISDPDDFFGSTLLQMATFEGNEALLYGVVAFSAYHYALRDVKGQFEEFLKFYNDSVTRVLQTFARNEDSTLSTLVTLLQLNTIESNFSDFPQLSSHHRAASELILRLYTPAMVCEAPVRTALLWYLHFDNLMLFWSNSQPLIPRDYLQALVDFCLQQGDSPPEIKDWTTEAGYVQLCLISYDIADHRSRLRLGVTAKSQHYEEREIIDRQLYQWRQNLDPNLTDSRCLVLEQEPDSLLAPVGAKVTESADTFSAPLLTTTLLIAQWNFITLMHESDNDVAPPSHISEALSERALRICRAWAFVGRLSPSASSACTSLIAPLKMAVLFLPRNGQYNQWVRESLAMTELQGVMMAKPVRACMANVLNDHTCLDWWLPQDEGKTTAVRNARTMADERWALNAPRDNTNRNVMLELSAALLGLNGDFTTEDDER